MDLRLHSMGLNVKGIVRTGKRCVAMDLWARSISLGMEGMVGMEKRGGGCIALVWTWR